MGRDDTRAMLDLLRQAVDELTLLRSAVERLTQPRWYRTLPDHWYRTLPDHCPSCAAPTIEGNEVHLFGCPLAAPSLRQHDSYGAGQDDEPEPTQPARDRNGERIDVGDLVQVPDAKLAERSVEGTVLRVLVPTIGQDGLQLQVDLGDGAVWQGPASYTEKPPF